MICYRDIHTSIGVPVRFSKIALQMHLCHFQARISIIEEGDEETAFLYLVPLVYMYIK